MIFSKESVDGNVIFGQSKSVLNRNKNCLVLCLISNCSFGQSVFKEPNELRTIPSIKPIFMLTMLFYHVT